MRCNHCNELFNDVRQSQNLGIDNHKWIWWARPHLCHGCGEFNIEILTATSSVNGQAPENARQVFVWPDKPITKVAPTEVPASYAKDYNQAWKVLSLSPEASAALSRRCLQSVLRDQGYEQKDLAPQIKAALDDGKLPSHIASVLDAVRNIGNFAAHAMKSQHSGEIVDVEPGEAEWNLEVLEALFDFYYVQKAKNQARIDALNAKLAEVGKPPIKSP